MNSARRIIAVMLQVFLALSSISWPAHATAADLFKARWVKRPISNFTSVTAPAELWSPVVRAKKSASSESFSVEYMDGERWITAGREEVALIPGMTSAQLSSLITAPPRGVAFIFARYVPKDARLTINAIKVEEGTDGYITVYQTYFSPYHGEHWAASRAFLTEVERRELNRAGRNPFTNFLPAEKDDPSFRNIGWDAAMVSIGLAMQYHRAAFSILNVENLRLASGSRKSGGFLKKKVTVYVDGYAVPSWFIGLPSTVQTWGTSAAICVVKTTPQVDPHTGQPMRDPATGKPSRGDCPDPALVAYSGVSFDEWKGGSFPIDEEHIYHWEKTNSGFTVIFFTILVMVAAFFVGPEIYAALQSGGAIGGTITGGQAALAAGVAYAGGTLLTTSGPASLTSIKQGVFGTVGDGTYQSAAGGSDQEREATRILVERHVEAPLDNLLQSPKAGLTAAMPDPSKAVFGSGQKRLRDQDRYCKQKGLRGDALRQCIVPPQPPIEIPE